MGLIISTAEARELLNKQVNAQLTDEQLETIIRNLTNLSYSVLNKERK